MPVCYHHATLWNSSEVLKWVWKGCSAFHGMVKLLSPILYPPLYQLICCTEWLSRYNKLSNDHLVLMDFKMLGADACCAGIQGAVDQPWLWAEDQEVCWSCSGFDQHGKCSETAACWACQVNVSFKKQSPPRHSWILEFTDSWPGRCKIDQACQWNVRSIPTFEN